jgi:hypothetical protein
MMRDDPTALRALARRCRNLARGCSAAEASTALEEIATGYDGRADQAEAADKEQRTIVPSRRGT